MHIKHEVTFIVCCYKKNPLRPLTGNTVKLAAPSDTKAIDNNSTPAVPDAAHVTQNVAKPSKDVENSGEISKPSDKPVARKRVDASANFKATAKPVPVALNENDSRTQNEKKGSKLRVITTGLKKSAERMPDKPRIIAGQASNNMPQEKSVSAEGSTKKPQSTPKLGRMLSGDSNRTPSLLETVSGTDVNGPPTDTDARHVVVQVPTGALPGDILKFRLQHKSGVGEPLVVPITVPNGAMEGATLRVRIFVHIRCHLSRSALVFVVGS